jgi:hypothetical protein
MDVSDQLVLHIQEVAVGISNGTQAILKDIFRGFPRSLEVNAGVVRRSKPRPLLSIYFQNYRSLIILPLDAIELKLLTASLNKLIEEKRMKGF